MDDYLFAVSVWVEGVMQQLGRTSDPFLYKVTEFIILFYLIYFSSGAVLLSRH